MWKYWYRGNGDSEISAIFVPGKREREDVFLSGGVRYWQVEMTRLFYFSFISSTLQNTEDSTVEGVQESRIY